MKEYKVIWYEGQKQRKYTTDDERIAKNLINTLESYKKNGFRDVWGIKLYSREVTIWKEEE